jgi:hypothetical protein
VQPERRLIWPLKWDWFAKKLNKNQCSPIFGERVNFRRILLSFLLSFGIVSALPQNPSSPDSKFAPYVQLASELNSRARANVYFANPQDIFRGVQVNFVHVGRGNLTFLRRDIAAMAGYRLYLPGSMTPAAQEAMTLVQDGVFP